MFALSLPTSVPTGTLVAASIFVGILSSGAAVAITQWWLSRSDRAVSREATAVETANDVVGILRSELKAERDRRSELTKELSERVAVLEARLEAADQRAERYATLLWETRRRLGVKEQMVESLMVYLEENGLEVPDHVSRQADDEGWPTYADVMEMAREDHEEG